MAQYFTEEKAKTFAPVLQQQYPSISFLPSEMGADQWIISVWSGLERIVHLHSEEEWNRFVEVCRVIAASSAVSPEKE